MLTLLLLVTLNQLKMLKTTLITQTNVTVDEITYVYYTQNDASQAVAINLTFA